MQRISTPPPAEGSFVPVVAGLLHDGAGRWLMLRRPPGKRHAGLWEFPGGKVEPGESRETALVRELSEELDIAVAPGSLGFVARACESEPSGPGVPAIVIDLYTVGAWHGDPRSTEGGAVGWFDRAQCAKLAMPPLDRALLPRIGPQW